MPVRYGIISRMSSKKNMNIPDPAMQTLLIPLTARAQETRRGGSIIHDEYAVKILDELGADETSLPLRRKTSLLMCLRAAVMDRLTDDFLREAGTPMVVQLGCGLDSRFERMGKGRTRWIDIDHGEVIDLRRRFFPDSEAYEMISASLAEDPWIDELPEEGEKLFLAEGVLMYLQPQEVRDLFEALQKRFPGSRFICDVFDSLTAKHIHHHVSMKASGIKQFWGIDSSRDICSWGNGIELKDELVFTDIPENRKLSLRDRISYRIADYIPMVKRAHRIIIAEL